jgi:hypothetical protein
VVKELKSTAIEVRSQETVVNWFEELQQKAPTKKK